MRMHHGGDIYRNAVGMDFSTSVNPYPLPENVALAMQKALERAGQYPDLRQERLRNAVAKRYGITPDQIVCGNGASELLMAVFHAVRPKRTIVREWDYGGYRRCAEAVGSDIVSGEEWQKRQAEEDGQAAGSRGIRRIFPILPGQQLLAGDRCEFFGLDRAGGGILEMLDGICQPV